MNMPDKETKGKGWKDTLENWEPKVDAGGWEALQQRVPSGKLFRIRQWVEGSAIKASRLLTKTTLVKVATVVTLATTVPSDITTQQPYTGEPTHRGEATISQSQPEELNDTTNFQISEVATKSALSKSEETISNDEETIAAEVKKVVVPSENGSAKTEEKAEQQEISIKENKTKETSKTTLKSSSAVTKKGSKTANVSNSNANRASSIKLASVKKPAATTNNQPTTLGINEISINPITPQNESIDENRPKDKVEYTTNTLPETVIDTTGPGKREESYDSTAVVKMAVQLDSLPSRSNVDTTNSTTKPKRSLSFYKAIAAGGGIFSGSNITGGFGQADFFFGANYGRIFGARLSASVSAFQGKFKGDSTAVADTDGISHFVQSIATYRMQQLSIGIDLSQRIWGNETTTIYLFEGVRGVYRIGESPKPTATTKFFPLASARLSVAIFRKTKYGQFIVEPNIEFHNKDKGNLPDGMTSIGVAVGWCF